MQQGKRGLLNAARLSVIGALLLAAVFLILDAGHGAHKSFFAVAIQSAWSDVFDWPAAWCSVKIIALGIAVLMLLDAMLSLFIKGDHQRVCIALIICAIFPLLLGFFGFYQLAKAVL